MSYIGQGLPDNQFIGYDTETFTGDGTANKAFTLSKKPFSENSLLVTIDGVVQEATEDFTVSGTTLTLVGTAPNNSEVNVVHLGAAAAIGEASKLDLNGASDQLILDADADTTISADTDDQIDFKAGGTDVMSMTATGLTINDGVVITTADNTDTLTLKSTDADAVEGPNLILQRDSASPADSDDIARIDFDANNDAGEVTRFITLRGNISDASDGSEDAQFLIQQMIAGSNVNTIRVKPDEIVLNDSSIDLDFRVESDGATHMLFVDASTNRVGIGTSSPSSTLDVTDPSGDAQIEIVSASTSNKTYLSFRAGAALHWYFEAVFTSGAEVLNVVDYAEGSNNIRMIFGTDGVISGNFNDTSDVSLKKEVTTLSSSDFVKNLNPVSFKWKEDDREDKGFIAQEIEALDSSLVSGEDGQKSINVTGIVAQLTKSLQEAMAKIETLETKVKALEDA
jgi:hypothetical protein